MANGFTDWLCGEGDTVRVTRTIPALRTEGKAGQSMRKGSRCTVVRREDSGRVDTDAPRCYEIVGARGLHAHAYESELTLIERAPITPESLKLVDGGVRFCVFLLSQDGRGFGLTDEQIDALFEIPGADEVDSEAAQPYKVIFHLDGLEELTPARVQQAHDAIREVFVRHPDLRSSRSQGRG